MQLILDIFYISL